MPRFKLTIEYAGTRYSGWQIQKNARTVQGEIDRAVRTVTGRTRLRAVRIGPDRRRRPRARRRSRTSTSARRCRRTRCARGSTTSCRPTSTSSSAVVVPHRFHARHDAVARRYIYQIARRRTAFAKTYVWWVKEPLDVDAHARGGAARSSACSDFRVVRRVDDDDDQDDRRHRRSCCVERARHRRGRRPACCRRRGIALPLEDGAPHGRRARRRSAAAGSSRGARRGSSPRHRRARAPDRAAVGAVSRARVLRGRPRDDRCEALTPVDASRFSSSAESSTRAPRTRLHDLGVARARRPRRGWPSDTSRRRASRQRTPRVDSARETRRESRADRRAGPAPSRARDSGAIARAGSARGSSP